MLLYNLQHIFFILMQCQAADRLSTGLVYFTDRHITTFTCFSGEHNNCCIVIIIQRIHYFVRIDAFRCLTVACSHIVLDSIAPWRESPFSCPWRHTAVSIVQNIVHLKSFVAQCLVEINCQIPVFIGSRSRCRGMIQRIIRGKSKQTDLTAGRQR